MTEFFCEVKLICCQKNPSAHFRPFGIPTHCLGGKIWPAAALKPAGGEHSTATDQSIRTQLRAQLIFNDSILPLKPSYFDCCGGTGQANLRFVNSLLSTHAQNYRPGVGCRMPPECYSSATIFTNLKTDAVAVTVG